MRFADDVIIAFAKGAFVDTSLGVDSGLFSNSMRSSQTTYEQLMDDAVKQLDDGMKGMDKKQLYESVFEASTNNDVFFVEHLANVVFTLDNTDTDAFARALCLSKDAIQSMMDFFIRLVPASGYVGTIGAYMGLGSMMRNIKGLIVTCVTRIASIPASLLGYLKKLMTLLRDMLVRWNARLNGIFSDMALLIARVVGVIYDTLPDVRVRVRQVILYVVGLPEVLANTMGEFLQDANRLVLGILAQLGERLSDLLSPAIIGRIAGALETIEKSKMATLTQSIADTVAGAIAKVVAYLRRSFVGRVTTAIVWPMQTLLEYLVQHIVPFFGARLGQWLYSPMGDARSEVKETLTHMLTFHLRYGPGVVPTTLLVQGNMRLTRATFAAVVAYRKKQGNRADMKRIKRIERRLRSMDARAADARAMGNAQTAKMSDAEFLAYRLKERVRDITSGGWAMANILANMAEDEDDANDPDSARDQRRRDAINEQFQSEEVKRVVRRELGSSVMEYTIAESLLEAQMASEIELMSMDQRGLPRPDRLTSFTVLNAFKTPTHYGDGEDDRSTPTPSAAIPVKTEFAGAPKILAEKRINDLLESVLTIEDVRKKIAIFEQESQIPDTDIRRPYYLRLADRFKKLLEILESPDTLQAIAKIAEKAKTQKEAYLRTDRWAHWFAVGMLGLGSLFFILKTWQAARSKVVRSEIAIYNGQHPASNIVDKLICKGLENGADRLEGGFYPATDTTALVAQFFDDTKTILSEDSTTDSPAVVARGKLQYMINLIGKPTTRGIPLFTRKTVIDFEVDKQSVHETLERHGNDVTKLNQVLAKITENIDVAHRSIKGIKFLDTQWNKHLWDTLLVAVNDLIGAYLPGSLMTHIMNASNLVSSVKMATDGHSTIAGTMMMYTGTGMVRAMLPWLSAATILFSALKMAYHVLKIAIYAATSNTPGTQQSLANFAKQVSIMLTAVAFAGEVDNALGGLTITDAGAMLTGILSFVPIPGASFITQGLFAKAGFIGDRSHGQSFITKMAMIMHEGDRQKDVHALERVFHQADDYTISHIKGVVNNPTDLSSVDNFVKFHKKLADIINQSSGNDDNDSTEQQ